MGAEAPRADQYKAKQFIESINNRTNGVPSFVISLKPEEGPEQLGPDDDLFIKDGKSRYPMIGMLNLGGSPSMSFVNRVMGFGINFTKDYQGRIALGFITFATKPSRRQRLRYRGANLDDWYVDWRPQGHPYSV